MGPLNNLMNKVDGWSQPQNQACESQGVLVRYGLTRTVSVLACAPLEVAAVAENALYGVAKGAALPFQLLANTFSCISGSDCCNFITQNKSTIELISDFFATVYKVIAYAIGTASTLVFGFLAPSVNLALHSRAGIFDNKREIAIAKKLEEIQAAEAEANLNETIAKIELQKQEALKQAELERLAQEALEKAEEAAKEAVKASEIEVNKKTEEIRVAEDIKKTQETELSKKKTEGGQDQPVIAITLPEETIDQVNEDTVNNDIVLVKKPSAWKRALNVVASPFSKAYHWVRGDNRQAA